MPDPNDDVILDMITYYRQNVTAINQMVDDMIKEIAPQPGDDPAETFAGIVAIFARDRDRATVASAAALMRLAATSGAAPCSYPGCGKPTAYLPVAVKDAAGMQWRHVNPQDETDTHVGYPMPRGVPQDNPVYVAGYEQGRTDFLMSEQSGHARRGDAVEAWIKRQRDGYATGGRAPLGSTMQRAAYDALDDLLDDYRLRSDTGTRLDTRIYYSVAIDGGPVVRVTAEESNDG